MKFYKSKVIGLCSLVFVFITAVALFAIQALECSAKIAFASRTAEILSLTVNEMRESYQQKVISNIQNSGIIVSKEYHSEPLTIPSPNSFAVELGKAVSDPEKGVIVDIFSSYPFYGNSSDERKIDDFQQEALQTLSMDNKVYERLDFIGDIQVVRHARAVFMEEGCIDCHNANRNSIKNDWKVGDLRGAIDISIPLNGEEERLTTTLRYFYSFFLSFSILGLLFMTAVIHRLWKLSTELELKVAERTSMLTKLAKIDALTSIPNRRHFDSHCKELFSHQIEDSLPITMMIYDLDHFKKINDCYGHNVGDECLIAVAETVTKVLCNENSFHARIGGEEFVVVIQSTTEENIEQIANRILDSIKSITISTEKNIKLTCSIGSTIIQRFHNKTALDMLKVADDAMYEAKQNGRDCWVHKAFNTIEV